ncbi:MAG: serine/threonine-protein kinase [Actinomycetota bacterium]
MAPSGVSNTALLAGRYRVLRRLGEGGMASVLLATDEFLGRPVAVKRLPTGSPEEALARFRREARLGASLNHPNIVSIYDSLVDEDAVLIVMEYVEGRSLEEMLRDGPLRPEAAMPILAQVAEALDHAHEQGVIHRDVKPSNVLIRPDGVAKLADLGIATATDATAITSSESVIGTLAYIAPERLDGETDHAAADVYALAALAYEALSGERAQRGETPAEIVNRAATGPPPDLRHDWPEAPLEAAAALRDGLSPAPEQRPSTAGQLARRLASALGQPAADPDRAPAVTERVPAPIGDFDRSDGPALRRAGSNRRRLAAAALAGAALLLGFVLAIGLDGGSEPAKQTGAAKPRTADNRPATTTTTTTEISTVESAPSPGSSGGVEAPGASGAALNDQGYALIQAGRYDEAIPVLQRAVESFPEGTSDANYAYALFNLGNALRLAGRANEAIPILEQRLQFPNQRGTVQRELELAYAEAGLSGGKPGKSGEAGKSGKHGESDD